MLQDHAEALHSFNPHLVLVSWQPLGQVPARTVPQTVHYFSLCSTSSRCHLPVNALSCAVAAGRVLDCASRFQLPTKFSFT